MPDIGTTLRETRMRLRIDISEVEAATKIRARYLRALENEEWNLLPGPTFVKTFLRTYAEYLGLDARLLVEAYRDRYEQPSPADLTPSFQSNRGANSRDSRRPPGPRRPSALAIAGAVFVGLLLLLLVLGLTGGDDEPADQREAPREARTTGAAERAAQRRRRAEAREARERRERRAAAARRRLKVRFVASQPVVVCLVDHRTGRTLIDNAPIDPATEPRTYRGRSLRAWFANGGMTVRVGSRMLDVPDRTTIAGYRITRTALKPLPEGEESPCA